MTASGPFITSASDDTEAPRHPPGRASLLWLAFVVSLQLRPFGFPLVMPIVLVVGLAMTLVQMCGPRRLQATWSGLATAMPPALTLCVTGLFLAGYEEARFAVPGNAPAQVALLVGFVLLGLGATGVIGPRLLRRYAFMAFLAGAVALQVAVLHQAPAPGDVGIVAHDSIVALLHGRDPYAITFPNPYDPVRTRLFYSPEVLQGDRLGFGYAYLPVSLLGGIPGFALGNVGYSYTVALVALTVLLRRLAVDSEGRILSLTPLAMPFTPQILVNQWVEPLPMLLLAVCVFALVRGRSRTASLGLGLLLASKQYFVVILPLVWMVRRRIGVRGIFIGLALAGILCGFFALWNVASFWHSTVWLQFHLPLRDDSVSLPVAWSRTFGSAPGWFFAPAAVAAGVLVSTLVSLRAGATATSFAAGIGLSLLATVVLSPHAFSNYYAMVECALVVGGVTWALDDSRKETLAMDARVEIDDQGARSAQRGMRTPTRCRRGQ